MNNNIKLPGSTRNIINLIKIFKGLAPYQWAKYEKNIKNFSHTVLRNGSEKRGTHKGKSGREKNGLIIKQIER